jgi:hypothetical protein
MHGVGTADTITCHNSLKTPCMLVVECTCSKQRSLAATHQVGKLLETGLLPAVQTPKEGWQPVLIIVQCSAVIPHHPYSEQHCPDGHLVLMLGPH